ncbi:unnamed protein product [Caenorhabditis bovis]|uniref:Bromo domain-containing protein n=1 Tax=Caenorhabditis bovis TaxID=2654633 RepID=A0A8S1F898_9PELO|nr:unnamed protein product [Caenorhabditis bovis]
MRDEEKHDRKSMVGVPPSARKPRSSGAAQASATPTRTSTRAVKRVKRDEPLDEEDGSDVEKPESDSPDDDSDVEEPQSSRKTSRKRKRVPLTDYHLKKKKILARKAQREAEKARKAEEAEEKTPEPEIPPPPVRKPPALSSYTPLQLLLDHMLRRIVAKDPEEYFAYPVTAEVAPDYYTIIKDPMDFQTMREKIEDNKYNSVPELRADFELIVSNACLYNQSNTVFHLAALRLSSLINYYFSEQYLRYVFHSLPFTNQIPLDKVGLTPLHPVTNRPENRRRAALVDDMTADDCMENAGESIRDRLTNRKTKAKLAFLDEKDGTMVLKVLGDPNATNLEKRVTIGDIVGPLEEGNPGLIQLGEHRLHSQTPVTYLNYGPFSSFAPQYDSTWATMTKEDTDLLLRTYGDRSNAANVLSIRRFVENAGDDMINVVDNLLDTLTDGEHRRALKTFSEGIKSEELQKIQEYVQKEKAGDPSMDQLLDDVATLANLGIDVGFINEFRHEPTSPYKEAPMQHLNIQQQLNHTGQAIQDLAHLQHQRLQQQPPASLITVAEPGPIEQKLAEQVQQQLVHQVVQHNVAPTTFVSSSVLQDAMGIDMDDGDLFSEFFVTQ